MNKKGDNRRSFLKKAAISGLGVTTSGFFVRATNKPSLDNIIEHKKYSETKHSYNGTYSGKYLDKIAFPIGGIGAGMFCIEGNGAISHVSVQNHPEIYNEPNLFTAIHINGVENGTKVLEGPVPDWKIFGLPDSGTGNGGKNYGLPRFEKAEFKASFPFCEIRLEDKEIPFEVKITGWSPFVPTDEDNSSLPVGAMEYTFKNTDGITREAIFSFNTVNFMVPPVPLFSPSKHEGHIDKTQNGIILSRTVGDDDNWESGNFVFFTNDEKTKVDYCWFRGGGVSMTWESIKKGEMKQREPVKSDAPGASLFVPFKLKPGEEKTIRLMMAWYVPKSNIQIGAGATPEEKQKKANCDPAAGCCSSPSDLGIPIRDQYSYSKYRPWYSSEFKNIEEVKAYWLKNYNTLRKNSNLFKTSFYSSTLPNEVMEAIAANLTILKSPTVLRQHDGRFWAFEGCMDNNGCCHGSCTHVWNYAQALPHLFPSLERSLRETEFCENQGVDGRQMFRADLPIRPVNFNFEAAADGQLGGIMKVYREWRISGNSNWMKKIFPMLKKSLDFCINNWDPRHLGVLQEPQHNTYDIDFWGPNGMLTSFYLSALNAFLKMGGILGKDVSFYEKLYSKGKQYMEEELFNGEYFFQKVEYKNLNASPIKEAAKKFYVGEYSPEALKVFEKEGPKYQYGTGCLSDGVLGVWLAEMCFLDGAVDKEKIKKHLLSVYKYNLKRDLNDYANSNRSGFAMGDDGGLLLCTWPKGERPTLPFPYSTEVWTGIEYQVASHLMLNGKVEEGLEIVRTCRNRYKGDVRNPFDEYECGHWYARAMSSYGMIQGLTGVKFDAVDKVLYIDSRIGDFTAFLSTETGFGNVGLKNNKPFLKVMYGKIVPDKVMVSGKGSELAVI